MRGCSCMDDDPCRLCPSLGNFPSPAAAGASCCSCRAFRPSRVVRCRRTLLHLAVTFLLAGGPDQDVFVGRKAELAGLADVVARVRRGQPWLVTIEGESGVGKTAVALRALASLPGLTALWARA